MDPQLRIELFPADLDASLAFYAALGFELRGRKDGPPRYANVRLGGVRLGLCEAAAVDPAARRLPAGTELVVDVDDVTGLRDELVGRGVQLDEDLAEREWGLTDFRVVDPDGYYWRFTSRR
ncbi:VOC family protein [Arsenicicoccus sp. oral taxon 190]|uniref:VOC family protein n=1 Tax=Arsenicicoccus sp. oral taxon 190 TaxID=1658671 RepID=UPI000679EABB|nr:VOC family protein [Arsenicicoccus sp. oral taxon 190]AKT50696.1 hypothetical protein ADJ73_04120 [Arsenicicoccus sp. oral taxon 190]